MRALSTAQAAALAHVAERAAPGRETARARLTVGGVVDVEALAARVRAEARITLSFHPDRLLADGRTVAERLLDEGRYRNQFETGISNGSRTAFAGGDRDRWEGALFGGAYQTVGVRSDERPKYGGLNVMQHPDGASPRFGSSYLELRADVGARATLTWGDSHEGPAIVGTLETIEPLLAAMTDEAAATGSVRGRPELGPEALIAHLGGLSHDRRREGPPGRALDTYIEAQVHGDVDLAEDVEALVVDPGFVGTPVGDALREMCARFGLAWRTHAGFVLATEAVPDDFRGPRMVPLARRVESGFSSLPGRIDAPAIGRAAASLEREPERWADWDTHAATLQHLKQLWHVLVWRGGPRNT